MPEIPPSLHEDICVAVGLRTRMRIADQARRDPEFRVDVLRAYEYRTLAAENTATSAASDSLRKLLVG